VLNSPNHPRFGTLFAEEVLPMPVERHFITESSEKSPDNGHIKFVGLGIFEAKIEDGANS